MHGSFPFVIDGQEVRVYWKESLRSDSEKERSRRTVIRYALSDVLDEFPPGEGPDFPCRVAWEFSWPNLSKTNKFSDPRGFDESTPLWTSPSCRTPDGRSGIIGGEVLVGMRSCDDARFSTFGEMVRYLLTGHYPLTVGIAG